MAGANWAGNLTYAATRVLRPRTVGELRAMVAEERSVKPLGTRHSFNDVADFPGGVQIDVSDIDCPLEIDENAGTVTVGAATRYGDLAVPLDAAGYALANLASLPHCTVAGSVATATHGSGERNRNLSAAVTGIELVTADGELRTFTRAADPDVFPGVVVGLGALGVVTRVTLDIVPSYQVRQYVFDHLPWDAADEHFDEIQDAAYSVSLFTTWTDDVDQVWLKHVTPAAERGDFFGATAATEDRHPVRAAGMTAEHTTRQLGVPGPWYDRIPHFRLGFTPSAGDELQSEFFVPRGHAIAAMRAVRELSDLVVPLLFVSEIRTIAGDDLWLSPAHGGDRAALHFTWRPMVAEVAAALLVIEERLAEFDARPHWGKLFHGGPWLAGRYPRMADFRALADRLDPGGTFRSPFVRRHVFGE
ncbi:MAG TPA: FAD-binding protein [Pseudonocardiaceae bacterium]|nr:FAD-binding protein [Pseudonocardiaceae bacterium]